MITGFFLSIGFVVLQFFVQLLPVVAYPSGISSAIVTVAGYLNAWTFIFPVGSLFSVLVVAFIFHFSIMAWHYGHLILRYLRGR